MRSRHSYQRLQRRWFGNCRFLSTVREMLRIFTMLKKHTSSSWNGRWVIAHQRRDAPSECRTAPPWSIALCGAVAQETETHRGTESPPSGTCPGCRMLLKQVRRPARSSIDPPNMTKSNGTDPSKRPLPKRLRRGGTEHGDWLGHNYYSTG